jgi:ubiquinone/menaquinone biosynthesis C-methylase UbiE
MTDPWYHTFFGRDYARFDDHPDTALEVSFLRELLPEEGCSVLDMACGAARHTAPLSRAGYRITGLDRSEALLNRARKKKGPFNLVRGDVQQVPLPDKSFDAIISIFSSIGYFEDETDNFHVFAEMSRVLKPGGRLIIDTVNRDFFIRHASRQSWFEKGGLTILEERWLDLETSRSEINVIVLEKGKRREYHHSIRLYTAAELAMLLAAVGIDTLVVFGDFGGSELSADTHRMIVVGEKRETPGL